LLKALANILRKAIQMRGSSISDFVDAEGIAGDYQQHHKVYGREGEKCFRCGAKSEELLWRPKQPFLSGVPAVRRAEYNWRKRK